VNTSKRLYKNEYKNNKHYLIMGCLGGVVLDIIIYIQDNANVTHRSVTFPRV
jgi:hypothetical protein